MTKVRTLAVVAVVSLFGALFVATPAAPGVPSAAPADEPDNVWLSRRPLNIAHAGGDLEAPHETMYAFKRAVSVGADALEMDLRLSSDGEVMVVHDGTVDRTSNGTGAVSDLTAAELQALDNAYGSYPAAGAVTTGRSRSTRGAASVPATSPRRLAT